MQKFTYCKVLSVISITDCEFGGTLSMYFEWIFFYISSIIKTRIKLMSRSHLKLQLNSSDFKVVIGILAQYLC